MTLDYTHWKCGRGESGGGYNRPRASNIHTSSANILAYPWENILVTILLVMILWQVLLSNGRSKHKVVIRKILYSWWFEWKIKGDIERYFIHSVRRYTQQWSAAWSASSTGLLIFFFSVKILAWMELPLRWQQRRQVAWNEKPCISWVYHLFKLVSRLLGLRMFGSRWKEEVGVGGKKKRMDRTEMLARGRNEDSGSGRVLVLQRFYTYSTVQNWLNSRGAPH